MAGGPARGEVLPRLEVLGPPAISCGPARSPIRGHPARVLVSLLASNGPCRTDRLIEALWGDDPPPTHRAALHVHLGALRRALAAHGPGCSIRRTDHGYALQVDSWDVDARLALDLLGAARLAIEDDPRAALQLAEEALALWRGTPYAVDGDVVDVPSWHRLEAARRDGEELLVEALLRTGDAARAEVAAHGYVEAEPLRENRWGQLLRARYLAGRTADALSTYQQARTTLIESLGIEPGRELRDLEAAALTQDLSRLRLNDGTEETLPGPPAAAGPIVGREQELQRVTAAVAGGHRVALLGAPGVGKTRLAIEVARRLGAKAVAWVDLRDASGGAARALPLVLEWSRRHPDGLIVLDNAETARQEATAAVVELATHATEVRVIVTSRVPLDTDLRTELLQPLGAPRPGAGDDEIEGSLAVQALRAALEELAPMASLAPPDLAEVCRRAGGLPLLLRLSAAAARALPVGALLSRAPFVEDDQLDRATAALLDVLDDDVREAFLDLCVLGGDSDGDLGARVVAMTPERFTAAVVQLVDHGLLQARPEQALPYSVLEPLRDVAARMPDADDRRRRVLDRCVHACIDRARAVHRLAGEAADGSLERRVEADLPRHRQVLRHLAQIGDAERALALVNRLEMPLYVLGWWAEKTELFDLALGIPGPPSTMRARAHAFRARPGPMHQFAMDHAERAESMAVELREERLVAYARHLRSIGCWWLGRTSEAIELARDAAAAFEASDDRLLEWAEARKFLGVALVLDGDVVSGLEIQRDVLDVVRRRLRSPFHVAHNLAYLGHCHRLIGDDTAALADWSEARELCAWYGNRGTAIHIEIGLGEIAADRGSSEAALAHAGAALELLGAARALTYAPWAWTVAMRAHGLMGDARAAATCARRALDALPAAPSGEAVRLAIEMAHLAVAQRDLATAARLLGVAAATDDRRELPFPSPREHERRLAAGVAVETGLGPCARGHLDAGRVCTVAEAAGDLLARA